MTNVCVGAIVNSNVKSFPRARKHVRRIAAPAMVDRAPNMRIGCGALMSDGEAIGQRMGVRGRMC